MPSQKRNSRKNKKDLALSCCSVHGSVGRLWDGAVTPSNIALSHSSAEKIDSIVRRPFPEYYPRIGERNASRHAALGS
jgi:hypothetical protein